MFWGGISYGVDPTATKDALVYNGEPIYRGSGKLSRKLLAYALNRTLILSDEPLIERMRSQLEANEYRFSALVDAIVTSPQFTNRRNAAKEENR